MLKALIAIGVLALGSTPWIPRTGGQDSKAILFRDLRAARDGYRDKLLALSDQLLSSSNADVSAFEARGDKSGAELSRGRVKSVERCRSGLKDDPESNLDDVARMLQAVIFDEVPHVLVRDGLRACFLFREGHGLLTKELVSGNSIGIAAPEWVTVEDASGLLFSQDASLVKTHIGLEDQWTVIARVRFPVEVGTDWPRCCGMCPHTY